MTTLKLLYASDKVSNLSLMFRILDSDGDRQLTGPDLVAIKESMPDTCPFSKEFSNIIDYFVEKSIMSKVSSEDRIKRDRGQALGIDFEAFYKIQKHNSLLLGELRDKLLGKRMIPKVDIFEDTQHSPDDKKERKKKKA